MICGRTAEGAKHAGLTSCVPGLGACAAALNHSSTRGGRRTPLPRRGGDYHRRGQGTRAAAVSGGRARQGRTTVRQGGMVDVRPAKDGAHRPPQSAGAAVRRRASASRRPHPASSIHTAPPVSRATDKLQQQQQGQRQQQQQHLIHPNREPAVSWHLAFAAEWRH